MKLLCALLLLGYCSSVVAQTKDTAGYYMGLSSTGTFNHTNDASSYLLSNGLRMNIKKQKFGINSTSKWLYGKLDQKLTNNDVSSLLDFNYLKGRQLFYFWGLANYNSSYSLKVNQQFQAGAGLACNVVEKRPLTINVSDGIIYDYSDILVQDSIREVYYTPRNSFRLQIKSNFSERITFNGTGFLQNSLAIANDYIVKADASLSVKLKQWLSLTAALNYNKMSRTQTSNFFMTYGITLENYF